MESADAEATVRRMFKYSFEFYKAIIANPHDPLHRGVVNVPLYSTAAQPYLEGLMNPPKQVILDFENGVQREAYAYDDAIYFEPSVIMQILGKQLGIARFPSVICTILGLNIVSDTQRNWLVARCVSLTTTLRMRKAVSVSELPQF